MRILKFVGAFLITFLLIFLIVFGFNMNALYTLWENQAGIKEGQEWVEKTYSLKGLTEYVGEQPAHVSIASRAIANPDSSILYNEYTPRTMGRLSVLFTLIEYARQVEAGRISPDTLIPLEEVERYVLPYMDASNHRDAIATLRSAGKITENDAVSLENLLQSAVRFNDIAAADYLFFAIGPDALEQLYNDLQLDQTELPLPFSGLYIAVRPAEGDTTATAHFDSLSQVPVDTFRSRVTAHARRLFNDEDYRHTMRRRFRESEGLGVKFMEERDALAFFPKTTAHEMSGLMQQIQQQELISPAVTRTVQSFLEWPLEYDGSRLNNDFSRYGALYDNRMGMVNGIDYGQSTYTEEPFAQAVFFDELPVAFWFHMSSNLMHQDFEQRLIWDPALREATVGEINKSAP